MEHWFDNLPEGFFKNDEERWILKLSEGDLKLKVESLREKACAITGKDISQRTVIGIKARLRRTLGEVIVPLGKMIKDEVKTPVEARVKKAEKRVKYNPLPPKHMSLREANTEKKRAYIFEYNIVRQMYKNYINRQDTLERYKEAREWFHDKYGE